MRYIAVYVYIGYNRDSLFLFYFSIFDGNDTATVSARASTTGDTRISFIVECSTILHTTVSFFPFSLSSRFSLYYYISFISSYTVFTVWLDSAAFGAALRTAAASRESQVRQPATVSSPTLLCESAGPLQRQTEQKTGHQATQHSPTVTGRLISFLSIKNLNLIAVVRRL
jgi:hypothetical protein